MARKDKYDAVFRAPAPKSLSPHDRATAESKRIVEAETAKRATLTATLKAARLAKEAGDAAPKPKKSAAKKPEPETDGAS
ncbi:hypothetical protein E1B25_15890 [Antarcticimicrobium sediminis]|uniref:Uncharacterized protein n=1 Tax=Antarcticimicrobium sediminis TaxID=2546227 RepID=A0A4R5ENE4_9RHOB|nr:hypothetical protein E1B25_15890 [Antarcticimicrobium sediminis]